MRIDGPGTDEKNCGSVVTSERSKRWPHPDTRTRDFFFYQVFFLFALPFRRLRWLLLKASQHNSSGLSTKESTHFRESHWDRWGPPHPPLTPRIRSVACPLFISPSCVHTEGKLVATFLQIMWHGAHKSGREKSVSTKAWNLGWGKFRKERERKWQPACQRLKEESSDHSPGAKC